MQRSRLRTAAACAAAALAAPACSGYQNALDPRGPQAAAIAELWWVMFWLSVAVFFAVMAALGYALYRSWHVEDNHLPLRHGQWLVVGGGLALPAVILVALVVYSVVVDRRIATLEEGRGDLLTIEVIGHQFWWHVRYRDPERPYREFVTANEIHLPVGRPVELKLRSADVIHSFWVPNLHGKMDMIPGRDNRIVVQADEAGVYRGQCAEFCGVQHAKMGMLVIAQPPAEFDAWWEAQLLPGAEPRTPLEARGQEVFLGTGCAMCHAVRGTRAAAAVAPDLTHFGSRRTIAAAVLPNRRGQLAGWLADPQAVKPGNFMPAVDLDGESLQALVAYLHSLR
jgi:cytochrome c oxidase subunit II